jgi:hypothetical protein
MRAATEFARSTCTLERAQGKEIENTYCKFHGCQYFASDAVRHTSLAARRRLLPLDLPAGYVCVIHIPSSFPLLPPTVHARNPLPPRSYVVCRFKYWTNASPTALSLESSFPTSSPPSLSPPPPPKVAAAQSEACFRNCLRSLFSSGRPTCLYTRCKAL